MKKKKENPKEPWAITFKLPKVKFYTGKINTMNGIT